MPFKYCVFTYITHKMGKMLQLIQKIPLEYSNGIFNYLLEESLTSTSCAPPSTIDTELTSVSFAFS